eukprot:3514049-Pyramimonas_sp.AAC.1
MFQKRDKGDKQALLAAGPSKKFKSETSSIMSQIGKVWDKVGQALKTRMCAFLEISAVRRVVVSCRAVVCHKVHVTHKIRQK